MIRLSMHHADLAVILLYLVGITWFGARFRKTQRTLKDYFLGGHTAPWWAISLSIVSAETSTVHLRYRVLIHPKMSAAENERRYQSWAAEG